MCPRFSGLAGAVQTVQRKVSSRGGIQVARQRIHVGFSQAGKIVTVQLGDTTLRIIDEHGELITAVPRNGIGEISRFKAYGRQAINGGQPGRTPTATRKAAIS